MGRKKKTSDVINIEELEIENKVEIDYDKLAQAIIKANQISKEEDLKSAVLNQEEMVRKRRKALGERDFSHIKNWLWRNVRVVLNQGFVFLRVLFVPKGIAKDISAVDSLFKLITALFLGLARFVLYVVCGYLFVQGWMNQNIFLFPYAFITFVFAQLIRIAQIEIEYMEDRGYLMAISSTIIAIASLVIAILAELEVI